MEVDGKTVAKDEGPRAGSTLEALAKVTPCVSCQRDAVTAGNSSQVSDVAAAALMMRGEKAKAEGLGIMGYFRAFYTIGVDPEVMGIGPVPAVQKLLSKTGLSVDDIGVFELNEAFAAQAIYCMRVIRYSTRKGQSCGWCHCLGASIGLYRRAPGGYYFA